MKISQLRQIIREEIEGMMNNPSGGGFSEEQGGKKFTLKSGDEIATIKYDDLTRDWYAELKKGGELMYGEFRGGYRFRNEDGKIDFEYGNIPAEEWKEMPGFETLADLYDMVKDKVKFPTWRKIKQY